MWSWDKWYWTITHQLFNKTCNVIANLLEIHSWFWILYYVSSHWCSACLDRYGRRYHHEVLREMLLHFHQWIQFQTILLFMRPRVRWWKLVGIVGWWILYCHMQMLSCRLLWKADHTLVSEVHLMKTWTTKKYQFCIGILHTTAERLYV
jgi:hypothetical protein